MFKKGGQGKPRGFGFGGFSLATKKEQSIPNTSKLLTSRGKKPNKPKPAKQHEVRSEYLSQDIKL